MYFAKYVYSTSCCMVDISDLYKGYVHMFLYMPLKDISYVEGIYFLAEHSVPFVNSLERRETMRLLIDNCLNSCYLRSM